MTRIFLSSPSDVKPEREAVARIVAALNADLPPARRFELIAWERSYYTADKTFQDQIARASECDLVICIFWKRLGSPLPDKYRRADGSLPTGTEFEFEDALHKATESDPRTPDVLVYRKTAQVHFSEDNLDAEREQRERFLHFWRQWFQTETGHFAAGFHSFEETQEFESLIRAHLTRWIKAHEAHTTWEGGSPFRGLAAFDVADAPLFFGRARETDRARARLIANALKGHRFLLIQGPSGSGKSSVARAGLLARLKMSDGAAGMPMLEAHLSITPGQMSQAGDWQAGLAQALLEDDRLGPALADGDFARADALATLIRAGGGALRAVLEGALARLNTAGVCLLVDQLEELFQWPQQARDEFAGFVLGLLESPQIFVIATMRSDYSSHLLAIPGFRRLTCTDGLAGPDLATPVLDIQAPSPADIHQIITAPAELAGLTYAAATPSTPDLVGLIEAESPATALPALQYLLTQLYEGREDGVLTHAAYTRLGGLSGVLAARGNAVLQAQPNDAARAFDKIVRLLVDVSAPDSPATARNVPLEAFDGDDSALTLVRGLSDAGLLRQNKGTLRFAHESLLQGWDQVADRVTHERRLFVIRAAVAMAYERYNTRQAEGPANASDGLLQGLALAEAQDLLSSWGPQTLNARTPALADFITASAKADKQRLRLRRMTRIAALVGVIAVISGGIWLDARRKAAQLSAEAQANIAEITQLALLNKDWDRAAQALRRLDDPGATARTRALALSVVQERGGAGLISQSAGNFVSVAAMADGGFATLSRAGELTRGDLRLRLPLIDRFGAFYFHLHLRPDNRVVVVSSDGHALLVSQDGDTVTPLLNKTRYLSSNAQIDVLDLPNEFLISIGDRGGPGEVLRCDTTGVACQSIALQVGLSAVALFGDGARIALVQGDKAWIKPLSDPNKDTVAVAFPSTLLSLARSDDRLIAGLRDGSMRDLETGRILNTKEQRAIVQMASHPDGTLAYGCGKGRLCYAATPDGTARLLYPLPAFPVQLAWDTQAAQLAAVLSDGTLQIWDVTPQDRMVWAPKRGALVQGQQGAAPGTLALAGAHEAYVFTPQTGRLQTLIKGFDAPMTDLAMSDAGHLAVALENGRILRSAADGGVETVGLGVRIERLAWADGTLWGTSGRGILRWPLGAVAEHLTDATLPTPQSIGGLVLRGQTLIYGRSDGALMRWDADGSTPLLDLEESADSLAAMRLALDPSARFLATTRADDHLGLYDLETGKALPLEGLLPAGSRDVAFSPGGDMIAVLGNDDILTLWRFDAGAGRAEIYGSFHPVPDLLRDPPLPRQVSSVDWLEDQVLLITTVAGYVLQADISWPATRKALAQ